MAVTVGPDIMLETPTRESFELSIAPEHSIPDIIPGTSARQSHLAAPHASPQSSAPLNPPPNPHFVFPARPASSALASFSRATGRRPHSIVGLPDRTSDLSEQESRQPRSPALPEFSFNPGAALSSAPAPETTFLGPPQSPSSPRSIATRPVGHGHRRGGSEFVGGSIRGGDSITVMSGSPTKSESEIESVPNAPPARRGHAHRRSAAISSHDLSSLILPTASTTLRGSSAPSSPVAFDHMDAFSFPGPKNSPVQSEPSLSPPGHLDAGHVEIPIELPSVRIHQPPKSVARNRVGFSDTLEFIPRPLSMVSSDTSSTVTARPGHSVSGSISSMVSVTNADREASSRGSTPPPKLIERRPSTAGAILERTQTAQDQEQEPPLAKRRGSIPYMGSFPSFVSSGQPSPSPTKVAKRWTLFGRESHSTGHSPARSPPLSACSADSEAKGVSSATSSSEHVPNSQAEEQKSAAIQERQPSVRKKSKKQKKVKIWAGSILSRRSKGHSGKKKRRTPTPSRERDEKEDNSRTETLLAAEPVMPTVMVTETDSEGDGKTWNAPRLVSVSDEDSSYPMIDLDAALGPFNTPLPRNAEWEAAQRAGGLVKKQLHSAAGMSRFTGPGMHYAHRRAESAPEMAPFEARRLGIHRFGSSSTMADVFEEDEEDEDEDAEKSTTGQSTPLAESRITEKSEEVLVSKDDVRNAVEQLEVDEQQLPLTTDHAVVPSSVEQKSCDPSCDEEGHTTSTEGKSQFPAASFYEEIVSRDSDLDITVVSGDDTPAAASLRQVSKGKDLAPVNVGPMNLPSASLSTISPYSMTQSSFPSPRSPVSYDTQRVSTAPSSVVTEDNFQSLLMGEPGPEVRYSVDDIPSLTSSNSTMTRESIVIHNPRTRPPAPHDQPRPASFTSTAFGRRRSSLASLSRLINSSHGERSKLSMEVHMDSEPEKKAKISKAKRLSRMMQFWKSKDSNASE